MIGVNESAVRRKVAARQRCCSLHVRNVVRHRTVAEERASNEVSKMNGRYVKQLFRVVLLAGVWTVMAIPSIAQTPADNTKANAQDQAKGAVTADQQKENTPDREMAQKIRQSLMNDKGLSTYAHNVKVIVRDGQVTLKGPVRSKDERHAVETKAIEVAGAGHVTNQISVAPAH